MSQAGILNVSGGGGGGSPIESIEGNDGIPVPPTANIIHVVGTGSITTAGTPATSTLTVELTGLTNNAILYGQGTPTIGLAGPSNNSVLTTNATGVPTLVPLLDGQVVIGSTIGAPLAANITGSGGITVTNGHNTIQVSNTNGAPVTTFKGNDGVSETPNGSGVFNILGTGSITTVGSLNTLTAQLTGLANHAVLVGAGTATITNVGPGAQFTVLQGNGASADPTFNLNWTINSANGALTQGLIIWNGDARMHNFGTDNLFWGNGAGSGTLTGTDSIGIGLNCLSASTYSGGGNVAYGANCLRHITSASSNCGYGVATLTTLTTSANNTCFGHNTGNLISTGSGGNSCLGFQSLSQLTTGSFNTCVGYQAGHGYTSSETNNICIGNGVLGTAAESNTTRIGNGSIAACYVTGIDGVNVGSVAKVVTEASNQLGTATITAGTGITVTPTANTITISASSSGFTWNNTTGTSATLVAENGYFSNNAGVVTYTLPTIVSSSTGDTIKIIGLGAGGWSIAQLALEQIVVGSASSTVGITGSVASTNQYDTITLVYSPTSGLWRAESWVGNLVVT